MDSIRFYISLAWRNIWRNIRRTTITVSAIFLSLFLMICLTALMYGFLSDMQKSITNTIGELQIHDSDYIKTRSFFDQIKNAQGLIDTCSKNGYRCSPRLYGFALMSSESEQKTSGVQVVGVHLEREKEVTELPLEKNYLSGHFLTGAEKKEERVTEDKKALDLVIPDDFEDDAVPSAIKHVNIISEVVLGKKLAENLKLTVDERAVVLTAGSNGAIGNEIFSVTGILKNISSVFDRTLAVVDIKTFQRLFSMKSLSDAHEIILVRDKDISLEDARAEIASFIPAQATVRTWKEIMPEIADMIETSEKMLIIMTLIMYIGAALVILNSILMVVFERIRELGIMKALGFTPFQVFVLVNMETVMLCMIATVIGIAFSVPTLIFLKNTGLDLSAYAPSGFQFSNTVVAPVWKARITPQSFIFPVTLLYVISFVAVIYPALKAALIKPVKAIYQR
ncbi:MAG: ABC transporter permease [Candidatus Aureabacteria bacterium]|nr:ABC transporter permease [Candidatus Auribacterota bacterium]